MIKVVEEKKPRITQALKLRNAIENALVLLEKEDYKKAITLLRQQVEVKERKSNAYNNYVKEHINSVYANLKKKNPEAKRTECMSVIANMWKKEKESKEKIKHKEVCDKIESNSKCKSNTILKNKIDSKKRAIMKAMKNFDDFEFADVPCDF